MKEALQVILKLAAGGLSEEERQLAYKLLTTVGYRLLMVTLMCVAYGSFEVIGGTSGFVWAEDVDQKIALAVEPLFKEQSRQAGLIDTLTDLLNEQIASSIATEIRYLVGKRCTEKDPVEKDRTQREIDRKKSDWKRYRPPGDEYIYTCGDV